MAITPTNKAATPGLQDQYAARQQESATRINGLYDDDLARQKQQLQSSYDQNLSNLEAQREGIGRQYQNAANDSAIAYERNRRNTNLQAMQNGLATGTGQQLQNSLYSEWIDRYAQLRNQEAGARSEADQNIANLKTTYENNVAAATAENANKRAAALLQNDNTNRDWYEKQAANLAQYGDFSAYESIYGKKQAAAMKETWIAANPDLAYNMGMIDQKRYKSITGKDSPGSTTSNNGGSYYKDDWHKGSWSGDHFHPVSGTDSYGNTWGSYYGRT